MKKTLLCLIFMICITAGATAYADGDAYEGAVYNEGTTSVFVGGKTNIQTVLITNTESDPINETNIVYVGQAPAGGEFEAVMEFALKEKPADGRYYMRLYNSVSGETERLSFKIGEVTDADVQLDALENSKIPDDPVIGYYSLAFVTNDAFYLDDYNIVKFEFDDGNGGSEVLGFPMEQLKDRVSFSRFELESNGKEFLGVRLIRIPDACQTVKMYLSDDRLIQEGGEQ